jgi:ethanolamine utilization protein EutA
VSGSTVDVTDASVLPLRGVPVARAVRSGEYLVAGDVADALTRLDLVDGAGPVALALPFDAVPNYAALKRVADALMVAAPAALTGPEPTIISFGADIGMAFGTVLRELCPNLQHVLILDGLRLRELDFLDVGEVLEPAGVVPVVVKSLAFPSANQSPEAPRDSARSLRGS